MRARDSEGISTKEYRLQLILPCFVLFVDVALPYQIEPHLIRTEYIWNMRSITQTHPVKDLERLPDLVLGVLLVDLHRHHREELWKVDGARAVLVHLVNHVLRDEERAD